MSSTHHQMREFEHTDSGAGVTRECSGLHREFINECFSSMHSGRHSQASENTGHHHSHAHHHLPHLEIDFGQDGNAPSTAPSDSSTPQTPPAGDNSGSTPGDVALQPPPQTEPVTEAPPPTNTDSQVGAVGDQPPTSDVPLEGGKSAVTISGDSIPPELSQYAHMEGGTLVIDAGGNEIPPLRIERSDVTIKNARISASGEPDITINGAQNVSVLDSEITGGTTGIKADHASNITVSGNWIHDMTYAQTFDTTAVEFDYVSGGTISGNRITNDANHPFMSDAVSMFESNNLRTVNNTLNVYIDQPTSAPLMVEGSTTSNVEVAYNDITYSGPNNVPPGLLGGTNISGHDNVVNGDTTKGAWQLYAYNDVWQNVYYNGERIS